MLIQGSSYELWKHAVTRPSFLERGAQSTECSASRPITAAYMQNIPHTDQLAHPERGEDVLPPRGGLVGASHGEHGAAA
eukprot:7921584-Pyramimonas_sp.AAC.1